MHKRHGWRNRIVRGFLLSMFVSVSHANEFCQRSQEDLFKAFEAPENRIGFQNDGGLQDGGVCWWHSRLQRSSIYLSTFAPEKSKPTLAEAQKLVRHLIYFTQVVEIPGYRNFSEFSADFEPLIQKELDQWQIRDGFLYQQWIRGLYGRASLPASSLKNHMNRLYSKFKLSKPGLWVMAQMPGITSHALLIIGMVKSNVGYHLRVIDSNRPLSTRELDYHFGDHSIELGGDFFTPYPGFQLDQDKINTALQKYCR